MNALILQFKRVTTLCLIVLALGCSALLPTPKAFGVIPPPDGGYGPPDYGTGNTAEGEDALLNLGLGTFNTATGYRTLSNNTTGIANTAVGAGALFNNTGNDNTATGAGALLGNTTGGANTANGEAALFSNTTGNNNTAIGTNALFNNITGSENTANGSGALGSNTAGRDNTATGAFALDGNTIGYENTAVGDAALFKNTTGHKNTAIGERALFNNTTGFNNVAIGLAAGRNLTIGHSNIVIANDGVAGDSGTIRIGDRALQHKTFIAGINTAVTGLPVMVSAAGQLGVAVSSRQFKDDIRPMEEASKAILALKPVTFHYKDTIDPDCTAQFGLVAEDVEKIDPDLVVRDKEGKPYSVRYDQVNAMLLNEFLKARRQIDAQQKQIDALTAGLQKVSAQLELNAPAPRAVLNEQ